MKIYLMKEEVCIGKFQCTLYHEGIDQGSGEDAVKTVEGESSFICLFSRSYLPTV